MATTDYQQLQGIRTKLRSLVKESDTTKLPNATLDIFINDFYRTCFVHEIHTDVFDSDFTQTVSATDSGQYTLSANVAGFGTSTFNGNHLTRFFDKDLFFAKYVNNETFFATGTILSIGTNSTSAVKNAAVDYVISGQTYTLASSETELSGDTVPQNKYGAWLVSVDVDGTVTITSADDNSTGYATPGLAVDGISFSDGTQSVLGFVTAMNTGGTFVPGTTGLDTGTVTDTYTDGNPGFRSVPESFLVDGRTLYIRPKSSDKGLFQSVLQCTAPTDLSGDSDTVFNELWGNAIAVGCAVEYLQQHGELEKAMALTGSTIIPGTYKYYINLINRMKISQDIEKPMGMAF